MQNIVSLHEEAINWSMLFSRKEAVYALMCLVTNPPVDSDIFARTGFCSVFDRDSFVV